MGPLQVHLQLSFELHAMNLLSGKARVGNIGRTLLFSALFVACMLGCALGVGCALLGLDPHHVYERYLYYPLLGAGQFFFVCARRSCRTLLSKGQDIIVQRTENVEEYAKVE